MNWRKNNLSVAMLLVLASPSSLWSQAKVKTIPDDKVPRYDVVSIKPNKTGSGNISVSIDDGNYTASNTTLKGLIANAYDVRQDYVYGLPAWAESAHFDIKAKVLDPDPKIFDKLTSDQYGSMVLAILVERFHLKAHIESKILPVYELVVAKGGPKIKEAGEGKLNDLSPGSINIRNTHMTAHGVEMISLANQLVYSTHRTVVDKTGLKGKYDIDLAWTRDDAPVNPDVTDAPPGIFTALEEQLGLKLQSSKGPVNTLVIEAIDPPTED